MKAAHNDKPPSEQIDVIIQRADDWRGAKLADLRAVIVQADAAIVEEVKWKKPSNPLGVPVWSRDGILCVADILKNAVRLTFPKGAQIDDPKDLFNTRLDSKSVRAIDFRDGDAIQKTALKGLIVAAARLNTRQAREKKPKTRARAS